MEAKIHLYTGPMCSGKTRKLLEAHREMGGELLTFAGSKHVDGVVTSRDGPSAKAKMVTRLDDEAWKLVQGCHVVFIDEGQFFDDLAAFCRRCAQADIEVHVAALDRTWQCEYWPSTRALLDVCDVVEVLQARCERCGDSASFSKRVTASTTTIDVGASYEPRCIPCWDF